eukprot:2018672-Prorocentrum_lima.AAC.1
MFCEWPALPQSVIGGSRSGCQGWLAGWCFHVRWWVWPSWYLTCPGWFDDGCTSHRKYLRRYSQ